MTLLPASTLCRDSFVARLDPRWRTASLLIAIVAAASLRNFAPAGVCLLTALLLAAVAKVSWQVTMERMMGLGILIAVTLIILPLLGAAGTALMLALKLPTILLLSTVMLTSAPLPAFFASLRGLGLPSLLVRMLNLTFRFAQLINEEFTHMRRAMRTRGFRHSTNMRTYSTAGHVFGTLIIRGGWRAERVAAAARTRGGVPIRSLTVFGTTSNDVLFGVVIISMSLAVLVWDRVS